MNALITQPEIIAALIAFLGVLVSVFLSLLTSQKQLQLEFEKLEKTLDAKYREKLMDRRLIAYQPLWKSLSWLNKDMLESKFETGEIKEHIASVLSELEGWYETNGITLSKDAYGRFTRLCSALDSYIGRAKFDNPAELIEIRRRVWDLRQMLRDDVHTEPIIPKRPTTS